MSKASDKQNNWKFINKTAQKGQDCEITTPEQSLCYPKNDFKNHPGLEKLLSYRKIKGDDKCNPSPKDPCVLDTTHMVIPSADVIRDYKSVNFVLVENDAQTASCGELYKDDTWYQKYGNTAYEGATATVEKGSYISYLANPTNDEIKAEKEVLNTAALADAESQLDCYISERIAKKCGGTVDEGFVPDQSTQGFITVEWGDFKEYLKPNVEDDTWYKAYSRVRVAITNYITTSLVCMYTNQKYTAFCIKPSYVKTQDDFTDPSDQTFFTDYLLNENGVNAKSKISMLDMRTHNYNIVYTYDNDTHQLVPGYLEGNQWIAYDIQTQDTWYPIDIEKSYDEGVAIFSDEGPIYKAAFSDTVLANVPQAARDLFIKGNHQGFTVEKPDQPVNSNREDGLYVVDKNTYFVQSKPIEQVSGEFNLDYNTAIATANALAKSYVKSSINCTYQNLAWTSYCPLGYTVSSTSDENSVTIEEFKYSANANLAQATLLAKAEADARISSCILTNSTVYIFCDLGDVNLNDPQGTIGSDTQAYHNPSVNYMMQQNGDTTETAHVFKVSDIEDLDPSVINDNKPIYIYLNAYDKYRTVSYNCFQDETGSDQPDGGNCYATGPSLSSYKVPSGYFNTTSVDETLSDLNSRAIQLAISSIVCQYGNMALSEVNCSTQKFAFRATGQGQPTEDNTLVKMDKICTGGPINPSQTDCSNQDGLPLCVVNNSAAAIAANTYFSTSPELVNTTAAKIQLASRVCLGCDHVGGGGGGGTSVTLQSQSTISCGSCSKGCCVFCEE